MNAHLHRKAILICLLVIGISFTNFLYAQDRTQRMSERIRSNAQVEKFIVRPDLKTPSFISFSAKQSVDASRLNSLLSGFLDVRNGMDELKHKNTTSYINGLTIVKQQQYFKGIKVEHGLYIATIRNGNLLSANGTFYDVPSTFTITPALDEAAALAAAMAVVNPKKIAYE